MTDDDLLLKTSAARGVAHRAPFAEWSKDHKGHSSIVVHTSTWGARSSDLLSFVSECSRRGLPLPPCDCPQGAHDWEKR